MDAQTLVEWIMRVPSVRIGDKKRYYKADKYDTFIKYGDQIIELLKDRGYTIKFTVEYEISWDGHKSSRDSYILIHSDYHEIDAYINDSLGTDVTQHDVGRFVKRCMVSQIKIGDKWISSYILLRPGDYARILMLEEDRVYLIPRNINAVHIDEVDDSSTIMCLRNDDGFVFLT